MPAQTSQLHGPDLLRRAVRGDLDWIVMKSLEKDRVRRYETASGLAEDIRRHLRYEPVLARGPTATYRLAKFLRRHRSQVLAALMLATPASPWVSSCSVESGSAPEAEGLRHRDLLSQAHGQYAKADRDAALETVKSILASKHVGPEAQLLYANILVDNRRSGRGGDYPEASARGAAPDRRGGPFALGPSPLGERIARCPKLQEVDEHRRQARELLPQTAGGALSCRP